MRRIIASACLLLLLSTSSMVAARTYKIGVTGWMGWSPVHVAAAKGFWQEQGIDVKVFNFGGNTEIDRALTKQLLDIGFEMLGTAVGLYQEGVPITILCETNWSHGGDKIIVKAGATPAQLSQKPIGVYLDQPSVTYFLHQYLSSVGLKLADVRLVQMEPPVLADKFIDGLFNAIINYDPDAIRAVNAGQGQVVATSATYPGSIPEGMIALRDVAQAIPPADLVKIFTGWIKAVAWSQDPANWTEYMEILNTQTFQGSPPFSEAELREMLAAVRIHDVPTLLARNQNDGGLFLYLQEVNAFLQANKLLRKDFTPTELFDNAMLLKTLTQP